MRTRVLAQLLCLTALIALCVGAMAAPADALPGMDPDVAAARATWTAATARLADAEAGLREATAVHEAAEGAARDAAGELAAARAALTELEQQQATTVEAAEAASDGRRVAATTAMAANLMGSRGPRLRGVQALVRAGARRDPEARHDRMADAARQLEHRTRVLARAQGAAEAAEDAVADQGAAVRAAEEVDAHARALVAAAAATAAVSRAAVAEHAAAEETARAALSQLGRRAGVPGPQGLTWPADGTLTSGFGPRTHPVTAVRRNHDGIDVSAPAGQPVLAAASGTVSFAGVRSGYGNTLEIDHGDGLLTRYAHLSTLAATEGQDVDEGDVVAAVGSTGISSGPHLHWEVLRDGVAEDPLAFF